MDTEKILNNLIEYDYCDYPFDYFITEKLKKEELEEIFNLTQKQFAESIKKQIGEFADDETRDENLTNILSVLSYSKHKYYVSLDQRYKPYWLNDIEEKIIKSITPTVNFI